MIRFLVPGLRLVSEANAERRAHWRVRDARATAQKTATTLAMQAALARDRASLAAATGDRLPHNVAPWLAGPLLVTIARISPRAIRDSDNLSGCAKYVRDAASRCLGVDDSDERIAWQVTQRRGRVGEWGVEVTIAPQRVCACGQRLAPAWRGCPVCWREVAA